jgi:iron complex transport system ATP-binding protein
VLALLQRLTGVGLTVLAVLHDLSLAAQFFSRLVLLDEGRLVADGPAAEVLTPQRIRDVYQVDPRFVPALA